MTETVLFLTWHLGFWSFEIRICFDIRVSIFEFSSWPTLLPLPPPVSSKKIWDTISFIKGDEGGFYGFSKD